MEKLGLNEIRKMFRDFYVSKDHYPGKSASLIPKNDKSLLIINSGMAPLKNYFSGAEVPPAKRMTTCQKCIRTGDIDNVGLTSRHGTFFEMLGNFSFGDYFKEKSLTWGWEFLTEYLKMPADKIWATIYLDDDEAYRIWHDVIGLPDDRIVRLGKEDNFWEIGLGPCGPDSEIFFDRGPEYGCGKPDCRPGCECDRYIEIWNHVFTQFSKEEDGSYTDLAHPNIDTGMGLERMACVMQDVDSIFDVDTIRYILNGVVDLCGKEYEAGDAKADVSMRIITDHMRSMVFMISDGIIPSNEGRGYVLRRLIRRAARHGRILGIEGNFLQGLADRVIEVSKEAYPELLEKQDYIKKIISLEECKFATTLDQGCSIITECIDDMKKENKTVLSGDKAFKLYDTYGFPLELTEEILEENNMTADVEGFDENMKQQKETARAGRKSTDEEAWKDADIVVDVPETEFTGYNDLVDQCKVLKLYKEGEEAEFASAGENVIVYLDKTPFYAEGGGQVSDNGFMSTEEGKVQILSVSKTQGIYAHKGTVVEGSINCGETVECHVNVVKRNKTARNHTATHLLQKALREVLGNHVEQAGSYVNEKELRFDFTHFEAVSKEDLIKVENIVNEKICEFLPVNTVETSMKEAQTMGAMALFGEKYGDKVRVVNCGEWSKELCGGTHVANIGQIGSMKIVSETGVASGVRRIVAYTGTGVLDAAKKAENTIEEVAQIVKASPNVIVTRAAGLMDELKESRKELDDMKKDAIGSELDDIVSAAENIGDIKLITKEFKDMKIEDLRSLSDEIKAKNQSTVMVFATVSGGKVTMLVSVTDDLLDKGYHAGNMIKKIAPAVKGGGGGKADMAQAGGKDPSGISNAFKVAEELLS
ncbi:alanine--tRNA ligase [Aminicella lysinilytica]|uniref:Alanine--tRNA ligase n=1 Tax=Aminicella lysinilytica TaxID=433323 RepID=A0A4R6Q8N9_9FIRM|nr:alanine--tRNA ligase [Aminicella lysinilytica]TDP58500.1 alanyl-tRNA synthetase [Aminicella lysinilytica]